MSKNRVQSRRTLAKYVVRKKAHFLKVQDSCLDCALLFLHWTTLETEEQRCQRRNTCLVGASVGVRTMYRSPSTFFVLNPEKFGKRP